MIYHYSYSLLEYFQYSPHALTGIHDTRGYQGYGDLHSWDTGEIYRRERDIQTNIRTPQGRAATIPIPIPIHHIHHIY